MNSPLMPSSRALSWGMAIAAIALAAGCSRGPRTRVVIPREVLHVSARSLRPAHATEATPGTPGEASAPTAVPSLLPSLASAVTPVNAQAEAPLPAVAFESRIAMLLAEEQARLEALTKGLEQLARWQDSPDGPATRLTNQQAVEALSEHTEVTHEGTIAHAAVTWSPVTEAPAIAEPIPPPSAEPQIEPLAPEVAEAMRREAMDRAMTSLRAQVRRMEVSPGLSLGDWVESEDMPPETLDDLMEEARVTRVDYTLNADETHHVCEIEMEFDTATLEHLL